MNETRERVKTILTQIEYVTLATSSPDGDPWNTPVYAAFDEAYTFFWVWGKIRSSFPKHPSKPSHCHSGL